MVEFQRILCPTDFSEFSERAFCYAVSLARHYGAELFVQHVVRPLNIGYPEYAIPDSVNQFYGELREHVEEQLREFVKVHSPEGSHAYVIVDEGGVTEGILAAAHERSVDLIVMGTHGRKGFERLALGSVTQKVLRKARCPVMAVRKPSTGRALKTLRRTPNSTGFCSVRIFQRVPRALFSTRLRLRPATMPS